MATSLAVLFLCAVQSAQAITTPTLTAGASGAGHVGTSVLQDTAELKGTATGSGTITFRLYGPEDPGCKGAAIESSSRIVEGDGTYRSEERVPSAVGIYQYVAEYSGDAENASVATVCGEAGQSAQVTSATPTIATLASEPVNIGGGIFDTARLLGGDGPTGNIIFSLFGPGDSSCIRTPLTVYSISTSAEGRYRSPTYTALAEGQYQWVASYSGDSRNLPVSGVCGEAGESVDVTGTAVLSATLSVIASPSTTVGGQIAATAAITAPNGAAGTLTFRVFGPNDEECRRGAVDASTRVVAGNGQYTSDPFVPLEEGVYRFIVSYTGNDGRLATTGCLDTGDSVTVLPAPSPVLDRSFTVERLTGKVLVLERPATAEAAASSIGFIEVRSPRNVPMGSIIDTTAGTAKLITATVDRKTQHGRFAGADFTVRQRAGDRGAVNIDMRSSRADLKKCARNARAARRAGTHLSKKFLARLRAEVKGAFRTTGNQSAASAHGTAWEMTESCAGTLTRVLSDAVEVRDFRLGRTLRVRAGHSYFAKRTS